MTFLAVFREGVETVLFLSAAAFTDNEMNTLVGGLIGLVIAVCLGVLIYNSAIRLNLRMFFNVTSAVLLLFAAGLFAHGIHEFQEAGVFLIIQEHVWDMNHILDENSTVGEILKALLGYNGHRPTDRTASPAGLRDMIDRLELSHASFFVRKIFHVKLSLEPDRDWRAKAYLGVGHLWKGLAGDSEPGRGRWGPIN